MLLKPCEDCRRPVSDRALECPNCGLPNPTLYLYEPTQEEIDAVYRDMSCTMAGGVCKALFAIVLLVGLIILFIGFCG